MHFYKPGYISYFEKNISKDYDSLLQLDRTDFLMAFYDLLLQSTRSIFPDLKLSANIYMKKFTFSLCF